MRALDLIPVNHSPTARLAAGEAVEPLAGMTVRTLVQEVAAAQAALYEKTGAALPQIGYLARDPDSGSLVGFCSFKDQPHEGQVEIAFLTFPEHEGHGYGLAMAAALVEIAFQDPVVSHALGHTLPERNASTRIFSRLGFEFAGPVSDPEDGTVWRWVLKQPVQAPSRLAGYRRLAGISIGSKAELKRQQPLTFAIPLLNRRRILAEFDSGVLTKVSEKQST